MLMSKDKGSKKQKQFADQHDDEEVLYVFRKHPIVMRRGFIIACFMVLLGTVPALIKPEMSYFYAGLAGGFAFIDLSSAEAAIEWIGDPEPGQNTRLNDGKVDRQGRFWCGSLSMDFTTPGASLFRLDPDLSWHRMDTGITVSNGIAFSLDGRCLYFSDSRIDQSHRYELDPDSGSLSQRLPFIKTGKYRGRIDGATVDADDNYWGALFDGGAVGCFSPQGDLLRLVEVPINWYYQPDSRVRPIHDTINMVRELLKSRRNGRRGLYSLPTPQPTADELPAL